MVSADLYRAVEACRICRSASLTKVIDLGVLALTGRFPGPDEPDPPAAPLNLLRCEDCGLVQLQHSVRTDEMFGDGYGYRSGINETMKRHLTAIAQTVAERANLREGDAVLDIGCNDGTLLSAYSTPGLARFGVDPIAEMFRENYPSDLLVHAGFFDAQAYRSISGRATARAITSISMFYDLEDPGAFTRDVASVLAPDGVWVLEQSYLPTMLERNAFDTICHEHLEYYALAQIERLVQDAGLRVFDVELNEVNGGSFQIWVCRQEGPYAKNAARLESLRAAEAEAHIDQDAAYTRFRDRIMAIKAELCSLLREEAARGKRIYVYGASTKGNVLLQYFDIGEDVLSGCADKNPIKWGRRTPGTGVPIVSEEEARAKADYFLVLPWHFRDEFIEREAGFRAKGGKLIFPLPEVKVF